MNPVTLPLPRGRAKRTLLGRQSSTAIAAELDARAFGSRALPNLGLRHAREAGCGSACRLAFSGHRHKCKGAPWGQRLELAMHQATVSPISIVRSAALALGCFVVLFSDTAYAQVPNIHVQETCRAAAGVMVNLADRTKLD